MNWLRSVVAEVFGLFVDDGALAVAILCWVAGVGLATHLGLRGRWVGVAFFAGLAVILGESALRFAIRKKPALKR